MEYHIREWVDESYLTFWLAKYCFFFKIKTFSACLVFRKY